MAVTKTYQLKFVKQLDLAGDLPTTGAAVTGLANGGFAAIGNHGSHVDGTIFGPGGVQTDNWTSTNGIFGALDQLSNGNIVVVSEATSFDSIQFKIIDSVTGDTVVPTVELGNLSVLHRTADVAALTGGGFGIVTEHDFVPDNIYGDDVLLYRRNNDGSEAFGPPLVIGDPMLNDYDPCIAGLDGGGLAVAWTRSQTNGDTEIWYAVYNSTGGTIKAPTLLDTSGTVNRRPDIVGTQGGGFAVVYEDNQWGNTGQPDITMARFNSSGTFLGSSNVNTTSSSEFEPKVTQLSNGLLAVAYEKHGPGIDAIVALVSASTGSVLAHENISHTEPSADSANNPMLAGFGKGRLAVFYNNASDGDIDGEDLQGQRTSTGDTADNWILGDDFVDFMYGGDGADFLSGGGNDDPWLAGEAGADYISGGDGDDRIDGGGNADTWLGGDAGVDYITGGTGNDRIDGGEGNDKWLGGDSGVDNITGGGGNDRIDGGEGNDKWLGGDSGADNITGGDGNDRIDGGSGIDTLKGDAGNDSISGGNDGDILNGGADIDVVSGGLGGDTIDGGNGDDGNGIGALFGNEGDDTIRGGLGNDFLDGGANNDRLIGQAGNDILNGGTGADDFVFELPSEGSDQVLDWVALDDQIEIDASAFGGGLAAGPLTANRLVVSAAPAANQAFGQFLYNTTTGQLSWDVDGTGATAAVLITRLLNGGAAVNTLAVADFDIVA